MNPDIPGLEDVVEIGRGGFATVYRAYQPTFRRTVAIKVLNAGNLDELAQERFRRECQAMGLLSAHPSILTVFDAGFLDNGQAYLVMPEDLLVSVGFTVRPVRVCSGSVGEGEVREIRSIDETKVYVDETGVTDLGTAVPTGSTLLMKVGTGQSCG